MSLQISSPLPAKAAADINKEQWHQAYQSARIEIRRNPEPDATNRGIKWTALLIISNGRAQSIDPLTAPISQRLAASRVANQCAVSSLSRVSNGRCAGGDQADNVETILQG
ncbi:hypothetical protein [Pseudomonas sp. PDM25]|jgi:hypothetical protein|uniref:hypothetical protein n=1 Tax=Pseudomonas sp. PDM25 TaxID=2854772 RepID=UPI001C469631|nr:hypothetical protein [Pseudomonas sp. PDM25]MBV7515658.1 hypothetical protein [Pseudomonas sp. PDM25]